MSKVSVIIISYNEIDYLERAIESCKNQTHDDIEIIVGDDGSTDGSIEYIKKYKGIKYFVMPRNEDEPLIPSIRVSNLIKRGIDIATGDYVAVLSGDDYYSNNQKFSEAANFLDSNDNYFAHVSGYEKVSDNGTLASIVPNELSESVYWSGNYLHISCFVFRHMKSNNLLNRMCDDTGLEYIIASCGKWKYNSNIAFAYYQRDSSIMHQADKLELAIIELMLYQDILNYDRSVKQSLKLATLSRFYKPFSYVYKHRTQLHDAKYAKYLNNCKNYKNDFIGRMSETMTISRRIYFRLTSLKMLFSRLLYLFLRKLILN